MIDFEKRIEQAIMLTSPLFYVLAICAYSYDGVKRLWKYYAIRDWYFVHFQIKGLNSKKLMAFIAATDSYIKNKNYSKRRKKVLITGNKRAKDRLKSITLGINNQSLKQ